MELAKLTVTAFVEELASESPAPGGGSVAAIEGALGASLVAMVARLTVGKEKFKDNWAVMEGVAKEGDALRERFLSLMQEDTEAFNVFMAAMKLPKDTDEQKAARVAAMQNALVTAASVPLATVVACGKLAELAKSAAQYGNPDAVTDAGTAASCARSGATAAAYNVRVNLMSIKDASKVDAIRKELEVAFAAVEKTVKETLEVVEKALA